MYPLIVSISPALAGVMFGGLIMVLAGVVLLRRSDRRD